MQLLRFKRLAWPALGVGLGWVVLAGALWLPRLFSEQTPLSCHTPQTETSTRYCVYYRQVPGILSDTTELLIGPSPNRGIVYRIPAYDRGEVRVTWNAAHTAVIALPGTTLTITAGEYIDTR